MTFDPPSPPSQPGADRGWNNPADQGWSNPAPAGQGQDQYAMQQMPQGQAQPRQPMPTHGQGMQQPMVAPKSVPLCVILSVIIPGLGSIVADNTGTGVLILVLYIVSAILSIFLIGIPFAIGIWIWGMIDAYKSAQKWNAAHGIIS